MRTNWRDGASANEKPLFGFVIRVPCNRMLLHGARLLLLLLMLSKFGPHQIRLKSRAFSRNTPDKFRCYASINMTHQMSRETQFEILQTSGTVFPRSFLRATMFYYGENGLKRQRQVHRPTKHVIQSRDRNGNRRKTDTA
jgi:hypothetical protein